MYSNDNKLGLSLPVFCTARIPVEVSTVKLCPTPHYITEILQLLNEYFTEAFEAEELKAVGCNHIAVLVDTLDTSKLTEPTHAPVKDSIEYPFLDWNLDDLVKFALKFGSGETGIVHTEFVILDKRTLEDKTVVVVTPDENSKDYLNGPRLTARADFRSSLVTLNVKTLGVGGDEPWEDAAAGDGVIRIYG